LDVGLDHGVGRDLDIGVDDTRCGIENRDAVSHQLAALGEAHLFVDVGQLGACVCAQDLAGMRRLPRHYSLARLAQNGGHVGEEVLGVGVAGRQSADVRLEILDGENV
jgi:hypothetical protein